MYTPTPSVTGEGCSQGLLTPSIPAVNVSCQRKPAGEETQAVPTGS